MTVQPGTRQGRIYEMAAQFQRELRLSQSAAQDQMLASWSRTYEVVRGEYQALLDGIAAEHEAGRPVRPSWLYQQERLANAEATAQAEVARYAREAQNATLSAEDAAVKASARHHAALGEEALSQANLAASFVQVNPDNLRHLVGTLSDGSPLAELFGGMAAEVSAQARDALLQGIALGKGPAWMARQVAPALDMPRHRAVTIMRTETQRVYREAARETYEANADVLTGWVWTATLTARTCPACISMHGTLHPVTETLDGHPRCRCAMVPRTPSWADLGVEGVEDTRPPLESGKDWLEAQPVATQKAILGQGKWAAWKSGEIDLDDVVARTHSPDWGSMRRERSLVEIREGRNANTLPGTTRPGKLTPSTDRPYALHRPDAPDYADEMAFKWKDQAAAKADDYATAVRGILTDAKANGVHINVTEDGLEGILESGRWKHLTETANTKNVHLAGRDKYERDMLGVPADTPPGQRPIYGWGARANAGETTFYGDVEVVLKPSVSNRTTWTLGDSIQGDARPLWSNEIAHASRDDLIGSSGGAFVRRSEFGDLLDRSGYVEAQVHGGVGVRDISHVIVPKGTSPELIGRLRAKGIDVRGPGVPDPKGKAMLAPEQYDVLKPDRAWSADKRERILSTLRGTPEGKVLADTLERFQDGGSIARLRTKIDKRLAGETIDATSQARVDALLGAIRDAPTDWAPDTLYRGMSVQGSLENVLAKYQAGADLDLSLTSFTSDRAVAKRFQDMTAKGRSTRVMVELVGDGKRALPIQDLPKDRRLWREKEWVTAGRFQVVEVKKAPGGGILLRVKHTGTL